jgi:hypothetical protein
MRTGELYDDVDAGLVAHAIVGSIQQALVFGKPRMSRRALVDGISRFCSRAVVAGAALSAGGMR